MRERTKCALWVNAALGRTGMSISGCRAYFTFYHAIPSREVARCSTWRSVLVPSGRELSTHSVSDEAGSSIHVVLSDRARRSRKQCPADSKTSSTTFTQDLLDSVVDDVLETRCFVVCSDKASWQCQVKRLDHVTSTIVKLFATARRVAGTPEFFMAKFRVYWSFLYSQDMPAGMATHVR